MCGILVTGQESAGINAPASCAAEMLRVSPLEVALAITDTAARLPLVGRHFEPLGTFTAAGAFGSRVVPSLLAGMCRPKSSVPRPIYVDAPAESATFVDELGAVSRSRVSYLELPGAGHAYDLTDGRRTGTATAAIGTFLGEIHSDYLAGAPRCVG